MARYVVQGNKDVEKHLLVHNSKNIKQSSIRILLSIAALFGFNMVSRRFASISSIFWKNKRDIYVEPTKAFKLSRDVLLNLPKTLYGQTDAGDYWHATFTNHLHNDLKMVPTFSALVPFLLTMRGQLQGIIGSYVDDTISADNKSFTQQSKTNEDRFE